MGAPPQLIYVLSQMTYFQPNFLLLTDKHPNKPSERARLCKMDNNKTPRSYSKDDCVRVRECDARLMWRVIFWMTLNPNAKKVAVKCKQITVLYVVDYNLVSTSRHLLLATRNTDFELNSYPNIYVFFFFRYCIYTISLLAGLGTILFRQLSFLTSSGDTFVTLSGGT